MPYHNTSSKIVKSTLSSASSGSSSAQDPVNPSDQRLNTIKSPSSAQNKVAPPGYH